MPRPSPPVSMGSARFRTLESESFLVTDACFPGGLVLEPHLHDRTVVAITLHGRWDSVLDHVPRVSAAGWVLTEPAGERHANHFSGAGARVLAVQPHPARAAALDPSEKFLTRVNHFSHGGAVGFGRRLLSEIARPDDVSRIAIESLCLDLLVSVARRGARRGPAGRAPIWLRRVADYLHGHFLERLDMTAVIAVGGVHPGHLAREFRRHFRVPMGVYVRQLRLDWAAERLATTETPIADIAISAGFADQSHFTRAFHRRTGLPPRQFRDARR